MIALAGVADAPRIRAQARDRNEAAYPAGLRALPDAPARVWIAGTLDTPVARCVAIVGSRAASDYGASFARRLAADLARAGLVVVSGLAHGIDAAAHAGALEARGRTVGVLPAGLDHITPVQHVALARRVAENGALLTERESGPPFGPGAFVRRNRLIAALSAVTVVVEAAARSGALSTATAARALGRPVLAVPGDLDRPTSLGTLQLLREGARPCGGAADVLAALPALVPGGDSTPRERLLAALAASPRTIGELAAAAGMTEPAAGAELVQLEWAGLARALPGQRWARGGSGAA
ncbi:MAG: DNA-protecting protein DprA [Candidatus Eisenbacteria bacterium]|uniref:DNA-protecting protein DprA n=1 Tax=Eiseniibacteriota bacterium TaxID=2212470 RepID=A0A933W2G7_UNCEI|nr:DNA-protecting protein DprA [Candidatus Eisenbacteria bacterium]